MFLNKFLFLIFISIIYANAQNSKLDRIIEDKNIKVCIWPEYYGISYLDKRTQELVGIEIDLAIQLAKDLEVEVEFIESSFADLISDITNNKCDIAMFAIGDTPQRRGKIRFNTPHLQSDIYAITTKNNKKITSWDDIDKDGVIVAVAKGTYHEPVMKEKLKNAKLLVVDDLNTRQQEVHAGRADVFMTDYPFVKRMLKQTSWAKLISPTETYHLTDYSWAMAYGDDKFYNRVEQFIKDIKDDGRLEEIAIKNELEQIVKLKQYYEK